MTDFAAEMWVRYRRAVDTGEPIVVYPADIPLIAEHWPLDRPKATAVKEIRRALVAGTAVIYGHPAILFGYQKP